MNPAPQVCFLLIPNGGVAPKDSLIKLGEGLYFYSDMQSIEFTPDRNGVKIVIAINNDVEVKELE